MNANRRSPRPRPSSSPISRHALAIAGPGLVLVTLALVSAPVDAQQPPESPPTDESAAAAAATPAAQEPPVSSPAQGSQAHEPMLLETGAACGMEPPLPTYPTACPPPGRTPIAPGVCHPYPQPRPRLSCQTTTGCPGDCRTRVVTGPGIFPASNPFAFETFPGTNFLPTVYTNMFDGAGNEIPNTLPSTPDVPYNLHGAPPVVAEINPLSPQDDLEHVIDTVLVLTAEIERLSRGGAPAAPETPAGEVTRRTAGETAAPAHRREDFARGEIALDRQAIRELLALAIDVLEGEPVPNRAYSGFPLLHYTSPEKVRAVVPELDAAGRVVGGNLDVRQIWYGQHIESDVAYVDPTPILYDAAGNRLKDADGNDLDVPWTVTYSVDVLSRGHDDFSPFVIYFDPFAPGGKKPHVGMDQTFFPMDDGTRNVFEIEMAPAIYLNLIYTWGWRMHPPRIQVIEGATDPIAYGGKPHPACPDAYDGLTRPEIERRVFCPPDEPDCTSVRCGTPRLGTDPASDCVRRKRYAIGRIGDLSPAKRMWTAFEAALAAAERDDHRGVERIVYRDALPALYDWLDRTTLPAGVEDDPESDVTILYVNNTIYGQISDGAIVRWNVWEERPETLRITAYNGDTFPHAYNVADFGGNRGWENQFKSSVKLAGSGCWFTFGRAHWWLSAGGPNGYLCVPPVGGAPVGGAATPGVHRFEIELNYEPSRRLRFYQFDPFHHDVAIFSVH